MSNPVIPPDMQSTSAKKLHVDALNESNSGSDSDTDTDNDTISPCYLLIDTELLFSFFAQVASCRLCYSDVVIIHELEKKQGFAHFISVKCSSDTCDWQGSFCTSKKN